MNKAYEIAESDLVCGECGGKQAVRLVQKKHGGIGVDQNWEEAKPMCSRCRKGPFYGSYRLLYHQMQVPGNGHHEAVPPNPMVALEERPRVQYRHKHSPRYIEPTFGWFMLLVAILAMIIIPFIWFIVAHSWIIIK